MKINKQNAKFQRQKKTPEEENVYDSAHQIKYILVVLAILAAITLISYLILK